MESLAVTAAAVFFTVVLSGPVAYLATNHGYVYVGGVLGLFAVAVGLWFASVTPPGAGVVGILSASVGAYCVWAAWQKGK